MPMRKSRYTEEQIAHALRQAETGTAVTKVCRGIGVSDRPTTGRRSGTGSRDQRDSQAQAARGGEPKARAAGGGSLARQADAAECTAEKLSSLSAGASSFDT
jgi:putative transposase